MRRAVCGVGGTTNSKKSVRGIRGRSTRHRSSCWAMLGSESLPARSTQSMRPPLGPRRHGDSTEAASWATVPPLRVGLQSPSRSAAWRSRAAAREGCLRAGSPRDWRPVVGPPRPGFRLGEALVRSWTGCRAWPDQTGEASRELVRNGYLHDRDRALALSLEKGLAADGAITGVNPPRTGWRPIRRAAMGSSSTTSLTRPGRRPAPVRSPAAAPAPGGRPRMSVAGTR